MAGYINGEVRIFCGDSPPTNLNLLWYKRVIIGQKDYYILQEFNRHLLIWQPINSTTDPISEDQTQGFLREDDQGIILLEDGFDLLQE